MITAQRLKEYTSFSAENLALILDRSGYSMCSFKTAEFLGITNGEQFCYSVTYHDEAGTGEIETGKVFVSLDLATGNPVADF